MALKLTRRDFLKLSGAAAAATAIAIGAPKAVNKLFESQNSSGMFQSIYQTQDTIVYGNCFQCLGRCSLEIVRTPQGFPRFITGTIGWHINDGGVCPRGASDVFYYFAPARLRYPLLRAGDRGEGKWVRVTYDQAFDIIVNGANASSWKEIGLTPSSLGLGDFEGFYKIHQENPNQIAFFQGRDQLIPADSGFFFNQLGTANAGAHGGFCSMNVFGAGVYVVGGPVWEYSGVDQKHAQYFILAGLAGDHFPNWMRRIIAQVRENGGKVLTISPERYGFYSVSDEHLYVNPATDGALAMGMIRVLLDYQDYYEKYLKTGSAPTDVTGNVVPEELLYQHIDKEYLRYYTNLSWLVIVNQNPANGDALDPTDPNAGSNTGLHLRASVQNEYYSKPPKITATTSSGKSVSYSFAGHTWLEAVMGSDGNVYSYVDVPWQKGVMPILTFDEVSGGINTTTVPIKLRNGQTVQVPAVNVTVPVGPGSTQTTTLTVTTAFHLFKAEAMNYDPYVPYDQPARYGALNVAQITGIPHETVQTVAHEIADVAFQRSIVLPVTWIDYLGRVHTQVIGRPVSIYFMRGVAAHANGFMSAASYYYLMLMLGAWDNPGATRYKYPYVHYFPGVAVAPHPLYNAPQIDPNLASYVSSGKVKPLGVTKGGFKKTEFIYNDGTVKITEVTPVPGAGPYGFPDGPDDLVVFNNQRPLLVDRGYSWELPLTVQRSISAVPYTAYEANSLFKSNSPAAGKAFPYPIKAMMWYITSPYWNNAYTLDDLLMKVTAKDSNGNYIVPFTLQFDLFMQETVNVVDLVLPDLSFLEIYGYHSTYDRPTSVVEGPSDSLNWPVLPALYPVYPTAENYMILGSLLCLPGMVSNSSTCTQNLQGLVSGSISPKQALQTAIQNSAYFTMYDPITGLPVYDPVFGTQGTVSNGVWMIKHNIMLAGYGNNFEYILSNEESKPVPNPNQLKLYASFVPQAMIKNNDIVSASQQVASQVNQSSSSANPYSLANTYSIAAGDPSRTQGIEHYLRLPVKFQPLLQAMLQDIITRFGNGQLDISEINPGNVKVGKGGAIYYLPEQIRYMRNVNLLYFRGWGAHTPNGYGPIGLPWIQRIYLEYLQKFRLAAAGKWQGYNAAYYYFYLKTGDSNFLVKAQPGNDSYGQAVSKNLLDYHRPFGGFYMPPAWMSTPEVGGVTTTDGINQQDYPLTFFVRRHDRIYHSWSFNVPWLTAMVPFTPVYISAADPYVKQFGLQSGDFVDFQSVNNIGSGKTTTIRAVVYVDQATRPGAAWVYVSMQGLPGFRSLSPNSPQVKYSVLNNWANISYMPPSRGGMLDPEKDMALPVLYLDPITGQTSWHDSRAKILQKVSSWDPSLNTQVIPSTTFTWLGHSYNNQDILSVIAPQITVGGSTPHFVESQNLNLIRFNVNNIQSEQLWQYVSPDSTFASNSGYTFGFAKGTPGSSSGSSNMTSSSGGS